VGEALSESSNEVLRVEGLAKHYPLRGTNRALKAVDGVSFNLRRGETLGIVGESGCGKSTTARLLVRLEEPTGGSVMVGGQDITSLRGGALKAFRRRIQMVFQDPYASLNPRVPVGKMLEEVLSVHGLGGNAEGRQRRARELLGMVALAPAFTSRYPHEMSGGQRQRVGIARALAVEPEILILDEPVSALDVSVQAEVMNLLARLRDELDLSYVFISHDLGMVRHISDRIAVMYLGKIVEWGPWQAVSDDPLHPYTRALQDAVPIPDPELEAHRAIPPLRGEVPDPANPPPGCNFNPRCPLAESICRGTEPALLELLPAHMAACHIAARAINSFEASVPRRSPSPSH
jgi:oligopeptide/dipeptide ABC transporter ATP-binding protein